MKCEYCGAEKSVVGYVGESKCPGCGLVWTYDEDERPTIESIRNSNTPDAKGT